MDRNTILAIVLAIALFFVVTKFFAPPPPAKKQETPKELVTKKKDPVKDKKDLNPKNGSQKKDATKGQKDPKKVSKPQSASSGPNSSLNIVPVKTYLFNSTEHSKKPFSVQTDVFDIRFTPVDGAITSLRLKKYPHKDRKTNEMRLVDAVFFPNNKEISPLATSFQGAGGLEKKVKSVYRYGVYKYESGELNKQEDGSLEEDQDYNTLIKANIDKLSKRYGTKMSNLVIILFKSQYKVQKKSGDKNFEFIKIYTLHNKSNDYLIDLDMTIKNLSDSEYAVVSNSNDNASFYIHWGKSLGPSYNPKTKTSYDEKFETAYLKLDGKEEVVEDTRNVTSQFKWLALDSRYLAVYLITEWDSDNQKIKRWKKTNYFGEVHKSKKVTEETISLGFKQFISKPGKDQSYHVSVFVGPKTRSLLQGARYEDFGLIEVRNRSWLSIIKPLEWAVEWALFTFNDYTHNYGLAIIILTILLKILMHPLTKKSMNSTRKMQELAPKMKELEAKYKKDPQQKQKAIMAMYKKEGVNPLGGCLPILLQLPVFWALYAVIPVLLDLKNAEFLWITDLSSPDTVMTIQLGITNKLNILPIIMTITSVFQMKLTPQPSMGASGDKAQAAKMMQYMMPAVFLFIFWTMPSGLVLYWTVQNMLQIGQQLYTNYFGKTKSKNKEKGGTK